MTLPTLKPVFNAAQLAAIQLYIDNKISLLGQDASLRVYADNGAAKSGGLVNGQLYRTGDILKIVHS